MKRKRRKKYNPRPFTVSQEYADRAWAAMPKLEVNGLVFALSKNSSQYFPFKVYTRDRSIDTMGHRSMHDHDTIIVKANNIELFRFSERSMQLIGQGAPERKVA